MHSADLGDQPRVTFIAKGQLFNGLGRVLGFFASLEDYAVMVRFAAHRVGIARVPREHEGLAATAAEVFFFLVAGTARLRSNACASLTESAVGTGLQALPRRQPRQERQSKGCIELVQLSRNGTTAPRTESTRPAQSEDIANGPSCYQKALYEGVQALDDLEPAT